MRSTILVALASAALLGLSACSPAPASPAVSGLLPAPRIETSLGADDGYVAVGEWLSLHDQVPAITNLDPKLLDALDRAAADAASHDIQFSFTDAWRSERYQQYLFDQAVEEYGSEDEARRWVKPAAESHHVTGFAVDVANADAMDWLNRFGGPYGLCQIYANELWHFEYVEGVTEDCPEQLPDSSAG